MGSDSEQFKDAAPVLSASASDGIDLPADAGDMLACIGYEAADPSLCSPHWNEAVQGLPNKRDWR